MCRWRACVAVEAQRWGLTHLRPDGEGDGTMLEDSRSWLCSSCVISIWWMRCLGWSALGFGWDRSIKCNVLVVILLIAGSSLAQRFWNGRAVRKSQSIQTNAAPPKSTDHTDSIGSAWSPVSGGDWGGSGHARQAGRQAGITTQRKPSSRPLTGIAHARPRRRLVVRFPFCFRVQVQFQAASTDHPSNQPTNHDPTYRIGPLRSMGGAAGSSS